MKVSELAKELKISDADVLAALKSFKLKSKDGEQELNSVVISVVRSHFKNLKSAPAPKAEEAKKETASKTKAASKTKKEVEEEEAVSKAASKTKKKRSEEAPEDPKAEKKTAKVDKAEKETVVEKPEEVKAKVTTVDDARKKSTKGRIANAPLITLKPLSRKRKKTRPNEAKPWEAAADAQKAQDAVSKEASAAPKEVVSEADLVELEIQMPITVKDLAIKLQQKPSAVLMRLMKMGIMCHINQALDGEIISLLTREFGFKMAKIRTQEEQVIERHKQEEEDPALLKARAPVITIMGHVDHGKTTLVDFIRKSKVVDAEHGGITQHMGAYSVVMPKGRITILDTPGHEAFTAMRKRGSRITDLVVLVVAADEGVMPQTEEAIDHARAANVPIVVALTKIDKPNANPDKVKKQLMEYDLASEDWGGKTVVIGLSGVTGQGVDQLLEMILLESELLELRANPDKTASGIVVEAHMSQGKGAVATLIVQSGTLKEGEIIVVGPHYGKVKAMFNDHRETIKSAGPSMPVEILGLSTVPEAGEVFYVVPDERQAREITSKRQEILKVQAMSKSARMTLDSLYAKMQEGYVKELSVIIKADVQGSLEALKDSLEKIPSEKVKVKFIHLGVGDVNASDVVLAAASTAIIIAFHVNVDTRAQEEIKKEPVEIREYRIIYDAVNDITKALEGLLEKKAKKNFKGRIEIRQVFKLSSKGIIAGCYVLKGKVLRKSHVDLIRREKVVFTGVIGSLKRFKDDVKEVTEGMECGVSIDKYNEYEEGDIIEAYDVEMIDQRL